MTTNEILFWLIAVNLGWNIVNCLISLVVLVKIASMNGLLTALSKAVMHVAIHQRRNNNNHGGQ